MNRTTSITLAILLLAAVAVPIAAAGVVSSDIVQGESETASDGNSETESIAPGERFSAAVGVQNAELNGNVSERSFDRALTNAESDEVKAALIGDRFDESQTRLEALENRLEVLRDSRDAGEISDGRYRGEVAKTVAEMRSIERQAAIAETTAGELPADVLSDRGVDVDAITDLRERAEKRGGPETAEIARSIAGNGPENLATDNEPGNPATDNESENPAAENHAGGDHTDDDRAKGNETASASGNETVEQSNRE